MPQRPRGRPPADQQAGPRTAAARSHARCERDRLKIAALEAEIRKLRGARFDRNMIEIGATTMIAHAEAEREAQEKRRAKEAAEEARRAAVAGKAKAPKP